MRRILSIALLLTVSPVFAEGDVLVAVASNFHKTAESLAQTFTESTGINVRLSSGSTGKLYAQIINGAPFDLFLAADSERPARLVEAGVANSRRTYAIGVLVLWSADDSLNARSCETAFRDDRKGRLSIANPATAPYGRAATEFLEAAGLSRTYAGRLVTGENVSQALQFADRGGARFGLVALSQAEEFPAPGCQWQVPSDLYTPIKQQAVLLNRSADNDAARQFEAFLFGEGQSLIAESGYQVAGDDNE